MNTNCSIRKTIIESASNLFYENGYNSTKIDDILKVANIEKSTLDTYFKSKEEICIAHLKHMNKEFSSGVVAFAQQTQPGIDRVLAIFNYLEFFYKMDSFNGCWNIKVYSEVSADNKLIKSEVTQQKRNFMRYIEMLIEENIKITDDKAIKKLSQQVYLLLESAVAHSNIFKEEWPITRAKELCSDLIYEQVRLV